MSSAKIWYVAIVLVISFFLIGGLLQKGISFLRENNIISIESVDSADITVMIASLLISIGLPYIFIRKKYEKSIADSFIKRAGLILVISIIIGLFLF